jgi:hypothetical protein
MLKQAGALGALGFVTVGDLCFPGLADGGMLQQVKKKKG